MAIARTPATIISMLSAIDQPAQGFVLTKNPSYWQASLVKVQNVDFPVYTSNTGALSALFTGKIVPSRWVAEMVRPRSDVLTEPERYGLGFWLGRHDDTVILEGYDAGVSFRSVHDPATTITRTVISNSSEGAWPIAQRLEALLAS